MTLASFDEVQPVGIFKNLLSSGADGDDGAAGRSDLDDLVPLRSPYAAVEAAIDDAVRRRNGISPRQADGPPERRVSANPDRRAGFELPPADSGADRRAGPADRRSSPQGFGKRGR